MLPTKETITVEDMCKVIGIDSVEKWDDDHMECCECQIKGEEYWDTQKHEYVIADCDYTCEMCEYDYRSKVIGFFGILLEKFDLELDGDERYLTWKLVPKRGWYRSAKLLIETINGYGMFEFRDVAEAISSGPYAGSRGFVMNHLGWMREYWNVYEGSKASYMFERWARRR